MGSNNSDYKPRKATFTVTGTGEKRIFTPVNRRAHIVAKKLNKRTRVTVADLQKAKDMGSYTFHHYNKGDGKLTAIKV